GDPFELLLPHERYFRECPAELLLVGADLAGIGKDPLFVGTLVPYLTDKPVRDVFSADDDAGARVAEARAQAVHDDGTVGIRLADGRVGGLAVGQPILRPPYDVFAETAEVARPRDRRPVRQGDEGGHARGRAEDVLYL